MSFACETTKVDADAVNQRAEQISKMILDYLRRNTDAGDTLAGVARWWLEIERIESSVDEVAEALESLMRKGLIRKHKAGEGTVLYKINQDLS